MNDQPRPAIEADLGPIKALASAAYEKYVARIGRKPKPMVANYEAAFADHPLWVVDREQVLAAVLELIPRDGHLLIENVAVHPQFQHAGLGRGLIAFAEREAKRQAFAEVRLYTNALFTENIALYARLGFHESHRETLNGTTAVHMVKAV